MLDEAKTNVCESITLRVLVAADKTPIFELALGVLGEAFQVRQERVDSHATLRRLLSTGDWDLLLCEPSVEHADCREFIAELREQGSDLLVVGLSDQADETLIGELLGAGVDTVLNGAHIARLTPIVVRRLAVVRDRRLRELQALLESTPDPMLIVRKDGRVLHANALIERLLGYTEAELAGHLIEILIPDHARAAHARHRQGYSAAPQARPMGVGIELSARHKSGEEIPVEISLGPVRLAGESLVCCGVRDLRERKRAESLLRAILEGTAAQVGEAFLGALVRNLALALGVRYAFISEFQTPDLIHARVRTFWNGAGFSEPFDYLLAGTPCDSVGARSEILVREAVRARFPGVPPLEAMGAESYFGIVLRDQAGQPLGVLAIADTKPLAHEEIARMVMRIFAARAGAELERIRGRASLARSEARFRSLTELSADWYWEFDRNYRFVPAGIGSSDKLPIRPPGFIGTSPWENPGTNLTGIEWAAYRARLDARETFRDFEYSRPSADGKLRWVSISGEPIYDHEGLFQGYRGVERDVTERKLAAQALQEREAQIRLLVDNVPAMICYFDSDCRYLYANRRYVEFYAADHAVKGRTLREVAGEEAWQSMRSWVERALAGEAVSYARTHTHADGGTRELEVTLIPDRDAAGRTQGVHTMILDVSERRRGEERLRVSNRAIEASGNAIMITEPTAEGQRIVYANPAFEKITGYQVADVIGRSPRFLHGDDTDQPGVAELREATEAQREAVVLLRNYRKDGTLFWNELRIAPVRDETGRLTQFIGIGNDVTARIEADGKVRDLTENLELRVTARTNELESANRELETFSYSVSHDLRAPLRAIDGFSAMLRTNFGEALPPEAIRYLGRIEQNALRMSRLIDGLLELSKMGRAPLERSEIDMAGMASEVAADLCEQAGRAVDIRIDHLPAAACDPILIRQVWQNLIGNALKFSAQSANPIVEIRSLSVEGGTAYCVKDNGAGFDMRFADKLFGVFQRLHSQTEFEGTGVGLATVHRIITRHGGRVWAEGEPGKGAIFYFTVA